MAQASLQCPQPMHFFELKTTPPPFFLGFRAPVGHTEAQAGAEQAAQTTILNPFLMPPADLTPMLDPANPPLFPRRAQANMQH